jgi:hypothetical protein
MRWAHPAAATIAITIDPTHFAKRIPTTIPILVEMKC